MHIPTVHEAHLHAKNTKTRESKGYVIPKKMLKFRLSKIEFQSILTLQKPNNDDDET